VKSNPNRVFTTLDGRGEKKLRKIADDGVFGLFSKLKINDK
jgi:hypothetical protein